MKSQSDRDFLSSLLKLCLLLHFQPPHVRPNDRESFQFQLHRSICNRLSCKFLRDRETASWKVLFLWQKRNFDAFLFGKSSSGQRWRVFDEIADWSDSVEYSHVMRMFLYTQSCTRAIVVRKPIKHLGICFRVSLNSRARDMEINYLQNRIQRRYANRDSFRGTRLTIGRSVGCGKRRKETFSDPATHQVLGNWENFIIKLAELLFRVVATDANSFRTHMSINRKPWEKTVVRLSGQLTVQMVSLSFASWCLKPRRELGIDMV